MLTGEFRSQWLWNGADIYRLGLRAYLEATEGGKGLYEKFGFRVVDEITFDCRPWGGDRVDCHSVSIPVLSFNSF